MSDQRDQDELSMLIHRSSTNAEIICRAMKQLNVEVEEVGKRGKIDPDLVCSVMKGNIFHMSQTKRGLEMFGINGIMLSIDDALGDIAKERKLRWNAESKLFERIEP